MAKAGSATRMAFLLPVLFGLIFCAAQPCSGQAPKKPALGTKGMVATAHPLATQAGLNALEKGGNAVDAAIAAAFALGVVEPYASGVGGGGFMLVYRSDTRQVSAIDYRETAPAKTPPGLESAESRTGPKSVGVPGTIAGLSRALTEFGTMGLKEVMEPTIRLAEEGFPAGRLLVGMIASNRDKLAANAEAKRVYLDPGYREGDTVLQRDLARTYRAIAAKGPGDFYRGDLAAAIAREMERLGGRLSAKDLTNFKAVARKPVSGNYRGHEIYSMPPPSSGGVHVIELLNIIENFDVASLGRNSTRSMQIMAEAMRRVFRDRSRFMGDPDFAAVPVSGLISRKYARALAQSIEPGRLNSGLALPDLRDFESGQTTHISVADGKGNLVAITQTINSFFGSGIVVPGTGIILNNEMADFGGWDANRPEPGKRPVSNMSPTIVLKGGKPFMSVGMAGATRIISGLAQIIINVVDFRMDIQAAINAPRFHCMDGRISLESRISKRKTAELSRIGYGIDRRKAYDVYLGGAQGVVLDGRSLQGGADPRRGGSAMGY